METMLRRNKALFPRSASRQLVVQACLLILFLGVQPELVGQALELILVRGHTSLA